MTLRYVNGAAAGSIDLDDRGLQYGDGLFETIAARRGRALRLALHLDRLELGCRVLDLPMPSHSLLQSEIEALARELGDGAIKLLLTRGSGPRGYAPPSSPAPVRVLSGWPLSAAPEHAGPCHAIVCRMRLATNAALAGIKHLNRLEQVLASAELDGTRAQAGLMLSTDGRLVSATNANLFLVRRGRLQTAELRDCGVAGTMRRSVLERAADAGIPLEVRDLTLDDLRQADGAFLCNALRGLVPLTGVDELAQWPQADALTQRLRALVEAQQ